jgi:hypothetical protein
MGRDVERGWEKYRLANRDRKNEARVQKKGGGGELQGDIGKGLKQDRGRETDAENGAP